jgi:hypothetical protein
LHRVDHELRERGELFRAAGVQDLRGYRALPDSRAVPRTLLIIDEFQEFFTEDDRIAQNAALLLDRIVRQGRAFGIHVLLGSQTLGGAYTLPRATLGQMAVRIALQCSEADSYLILSEDNAAARLLSRPGEAIYNDSSGLVQGNCPMQVVWLPDAERDDALDRIATLARTRGWQRPDELIVFEGNAPGDVRQNRNFTALIAGDRAKEPASSPRVWLGAANAIKGPTEAVFDRRSGANLLIVGQRDETALALLTFAVAALAAQNPEESARFLMLGTDASDCAPAGFMSRLQEALPQSVEWLKYSDVPDAVTQLHAEVLARQEANATTQPPTYVLVHALHRFTKLRYEDDFGLSDAAEARPDQQFQTIMAEGPAVGVHVLAWCDTLTSVTRTLGRRGLGEFAMRVLFQMSPGDSSGLIDDARASRLGLHGGLFYHEQEGIVEKFRPYALPDTGWLQTLGEHFHGKTAR